MQLREHALETGEGLSELALRAEEALNCYAGRIDHDWAVWFMIQRAYAFDGLQRYNEAQEVVDEFFNTYLSETDSAAVARFYMWDLRFKHFDGRFKEALESYNKGLLYAHKLPEDFYKHYLLNAGSVHMAQGKFKEALNIYRDAHQTFTTIPSPSTPMAEVYGRTLLGMASAQLDMVLYQNQAGIDLDTLIVGLTQATGLFTITESHEYHASAQSALALAYALTGEPQQGKLFLDLASSIATRHNLRRERILTLYHRALIYFLNQEYPKALADIDEALSQSKRFSLREFDVRLLYLQAQTHEEAGNFTEASEAYSDTADAAQQSAYGRDQLLFRPSSNAFRRVQAEIPPPDSAFPYLTYGFFALALALIVALLAYFAFLSPRRKTQRTEPPNTPTTDTAPLPADAEASDSLTGTPTPTTQHAEPPPSVDQETPPPKQPAERPTQPTEPPTPAEQPSDPAYVRCHRRAYQALKEPEEAASLIDDPVMSNYLRKGGIRQKGELYDVTAGLVRVLDGKDIDSTAVRSALSRGFEKRGWDWPRSFEALKRHILAHPPEGV